MTTVAAVLRLRRKRHNVAGWRASLSGLAIVWAATAAPLPISASETPPETGTISGSVLSNDGATPLHLASVSLMALPRNLRDEAGARGEGLVRRVLTSVDGSYRFAKVPLGPYRLVFRRVGFRPVSIDVELLAASAVAVSAALEVLPVFLEALEVKTTTPDHYGRESAESGRDGYWRVEQERWRQREYLSPDVRTVTHQDVREAITLGAPDVFRALQRVSGVGTRDDWTAEAWVRGAPWSQTRVYFDEMPLLNPLHGAGLASAVGPDALGSVLFYPGVRSVSVGEGGAGVISLRSRAATGDGDLRGFGSVSLLGAGLTLERRFADGRAGATVAARRSGLGIVATELEPNSRRLGELELPDDYADVTGRFDVDVGSGWRVEMSGTWGRDWIREDLDNGPAHNTFRWGNTAARLTLEGPVGSAKRTRHTVGVSRFDVAVRQDGIGSTISRFNDLGASPSQPDSDGEVRYLTVKGEVGSIDHAALDNGAVAWRGGYQFTHQQSRYVGAPVSPHPIQTVLGSTAFHQDLAVASAWTEGRWTPVRNLQIQAGLRVDGSAPIETQPALRLAPQVATRYRFGPRASVTAAAGRSYQYLQALAPAGLAVGPGLPVSHIWILAGESTPALRTDMVTLGAESWLGKSWLASVNLYVRHASGVALIDPAASAPGEGSAIEQGENRARGVEATMRRLAGAWTFSMAYGFGISEMRAARLHFPSSSDRRHTIDVTSWWRVPKSFLGGSVGLGGALAASSGAPYTRLFPGVLECDAASATCDEIVPDVRGAPNAARAPWYASLDAVIDWQRTWTAWSLGAFVQLVNVLDRNNAVAYTVQRHGPCSRTSVDAPLCQVDADEFLGGRPRTAIVGLRFAF